MESKKLTTNHVRIAFSLGWIFSLGLCFPVAAQQDSPQQRGSRKFEVRLVRETNKASNSTDLNEAVNLYKAGDYNAAKLCFWRRSQENPKDYTSHYYLANSFMQMKDFKNARTWYENCLHCNPDAETARNCSKALSYLNESTGTDANGSAKKDSQSSTADSSVTGNQSTSNQAALRSPLSCSSRDTAGEAVMRHVKQPPIGLVKCLDETDRANRNVSFSVRYGLETIPERVLTDLMSAGYSIVITPTILDAMPRRAGYSPRGYGDDTNYDNAAALFKTDSKQILIAERLQLSKNSLDFKNNDFATDAVRHELGHAVDCNSGYPSRGSAFKAAYDKDERKLSGFDRNRFAYFLQPGDAGRSELFAQFFAAKYTPDNWQNKQMIDLLNVFPDVIPLMKDY